MSALLNRGFLVQNLCFLYRTMLASAPLLEFAIKKSSGRLKKYYQYHLGEETGHEEMVKADLLTLGVFDIPHYYAAAMAAGSQYYFIAHYHPALLLGYMHVMESHPLSLPVIEETETAHGCALSVLRHHSEHDPEHSKQLIVIIESLPEALRAAIAWNKQCVTDILQTESNRWLNA